jgi:hypothetical protein
MNAGHDRLAAIEKRRDPSGFFHRNQNIAPAGR